MLYEFCAENVTLLEKAMQAGARRVELCDNLSVGGTTPSYGVIRAAVDLAKSYETTIMTMIRPRGGDFVYTDLEVEIMLEDIKKAREAGSQGVVYGLLTVENELDTENLESLLAVSQGLEVVFHMAFDSIPKDKQFEALDWLADHGVKRIDSWWSSYGDDSRTLCLVKRAGGLCRQADSNPARRWYYDSKSR